MRWVPIRYRDFYDLPRIFLAEHQGRTLLFDCPFDDVRDDYRDHYRVYELASGVAVPEEGSWHGLARAGRFLGEVPVAAVAFDPTRRAAVDDAVLTSL